MANRKSKRRNSEKRKEKSRDAARCRRTKESEVFFDLANMLPLSHSQTLQQDKASIMRLAISHLKLRKLLGTDMCLGEHRDTLQRKLDIQYSKALDGFVLVLDKEGDMVYLSEPVSKHLGLTQLDLIGHSIYDFTHPCDHDEIRDMLTEKVPSPGCRADDRNFLIRMKCTLTTKGRNINLKSATYKVVRCSGRYVTASSGSPHFLGVLDDKSLSCLLLIGEPIPHPSNIEVPLDARTFVSRHAMDMKITYCDDRITDLLGYDCQSIVNHSVFDFHHALDADTVKAACKNLFSKGQTVISNYRFLACGGGYCWVQTEATIITNQRTSKPQCIVCLNYILSEIEEKGLILSNVQAAMSPLSETSRMSKPAVLCREQNCLPTPMECSIPTLPSGVMLSTESIFAPKPNDADRDLLCITDIDGKVDMLDDLTELAPSAGNVMMPLIFSDNVLPNTVEESVSFPTAPVSANPIVTSPATQVTTGATNSDPCTEIMKVLDLSFLRSQAPVSAATCQPNNEGNSVPPEVSAACQAASKPEVETTSTSLLTVKEGLEDWDLDMRAPYIPMDGEEDQLFETNPVPLWDEENEFSQMLGITETVFAPKPPDPNDDEENSKRHIPMSILRLQAMKKNTTMSNEDIARHAGPPKMKRPMEINRLETGPPNQKTPRLTEVEVRASKSIAGISKSEVVEAARSAQPVTQNVKTTRSIPNPVKETPGIQYPEVSSFFREQSSSPPPSILKNLLTSGEDVNFGYRIEATKAVHQGSTLQSLLLADNSYSEDEGESDDSDEDMVLSSATLTKAQPALQQQGQGQPNLVIIRADNTMLFAPITANRKGERPKVVSVACATGGKK